MPVQQLAPKPALIAADLQKVLVGLPLLPPIAREIAALPSDR